MQSAAHTGSTSHVERWHSEMPLAVLIGLIAASIWLLLAVTIIGIVYAVMIGMFFWVGHLVFITHLRGSAVRVGPAQFADLHQRVNELSRAVGLAQPPVAYVMESSGSLNALATRFLRTDFIVLFSDLLEACGENDEARDFIIAHELGHLRAGHLRWRWFLLPGLVAPFLGSAYSRACEFTADRYGMSVAKDRRLALRGLAILAAGGRRGGALDLSSLASQRSDLNTPLMKIGTWLSTHPPLCERIAILEPALLAGGLTSQSSAAFGGVALMAGVFIVPVVLMVVVVGALVAAAGAARASMPLAEYQPPSVATQMAATPVAARIPSAAIEGDASARAQRDLATIAAVVDRHRASHNGELPANVDAVYEAWAEAHPGQAAPMDPFDGDRYGYEAQGSDYRLWSSGPGIEYSSRTAGSAR
jgi:Zn-dependent protease with chaperone function